MGEDLLKQLAEDAKKAGDVRPATTLYMNHAGKCIELCTDSKASSYSDWIKGEGADIGLMREQGTDRVVGVRLPMYHEKLFVDGDADHAALEADYERLRNAAQAFDGVLSTDCDCEERESLRAALTPKGE